MERGRALNLVREFTILVILFFVGLLASCKPHKIGHCRPPRWKVQGVKDLVVSTEGKGIALFVLNVRVDYYRTNKASIDVYYASPSTFYIKTSYSLAPDKLTSNFDEFLNLDIYPVEDTTDSFLFSGIFCTEKLTYPVRLSIF